MKGHVEKGRRAYWLLPLPNEFLYCKEPETVFPLGSLTELLLIDSVYQFGMYLAAGRVVPLSLLTEN